MESVEYSCRGWIMFKTLVTALLQIAALVWIGYAVARKKVFTKEGFDQLTGFLLKVVFPCKLIMSGNLDYSPEVSRSIILALELSVIYFVISILLSIIVFHFKELSGIAIMESVYSNVVFVGFPLALSLYGAEGLLYAIVFNVVFNAFFYVSAAFFMQRESGGLRIKDILNPLSVVSMLSMALFFLPWRIPASVGKVLDDIGNMSTAISLMLIGSWIVDMHWKDVFLDLKSYAVCAMRLLALPLLFAFGLWAFKVQYSMVVAVVLLISALPVGSMTVVMSRQYKLDVGFANRTMVLSMVLCLPSLALLMKVFGLMFS